MESNRGTLLIREFTIRGSTARVIFVTFLENASCHPVVH